MTTKRKDELIPLDRARLLNVLSAAIKHAKVQHGRIRDVKNEKIRLERVRVLAYLCNVGNTVLKDKELTDIEQRLDALEQNANNKQD